MDTSQFIPDQPAPEGRVLAVFRKALIWSLTALLIVLVPSCVVSFSPTLKRKVFGPDYLASVTLEPEKVTVSVELMVKDPFGKVQYERSLSVAAPDGSRVTTDLAQDHGGFSSANLYRTKDGNLVLADAFESDLVSLAPLRIIPYSENYFGNVDKGMYGETDLRSKPPPRDDKQHLGELLESSYFHGLFYVGAFRFQETRAADGHRSLAWSFAPASEQEEFIKAPSAADRRS